MAKDAVKPETPTVGNIVDFLDSVAPREMAAEWDNVGLLLGDRDSEVSRTLTCLTLTPDVAAEAIAANVELIVTHHPILFRPMQRLTAGTSEGRMLLDLARAGVAVYSPHTAFDNTVGGINDVLAAHLGLTEVKPLRTGTSPPQCKMVVFVPESDLPKVSDALFTSGAGRIGQYRECGFRVPGTGTFFGTEPTNPAVGQKGQREEVAEWRLEVICPEHAVDRAVAAMRRAHSYEEPAYDVYPIRPSVSAMGEGRCGRLKKKTSLESLAKAIKKSLHAETVQVVGDGQRVVERVAIVCGAGGEFVKDAIAARVDVLLTGEVRFHDCLAARTGGLSLVLPGHYATERFGIEALAVQIQKDWPSLTVWASRVESDPLASV